MAVCGVVSRCKVLFVIDINRAFNVTCLLGVGPRNKESWARRRRLCSRAGVGRGPPGAPSSAFAPPPGCRACSSLGSSPSASAGVVGHLGSISEPIKGEVTVEYFRGLPQVTVPLPSRRELCRFTLRPITHTVGDFLRMLRTEDRGIDRVALATAEGVRIASSNTIEALMERDFCLVINDTVYYVATPPQEKLSLEEVRRLSNVKNLVNQLYEALNVDEHQLKKERELLSQLESLRIQLEPMEMKRKELEMFSDRRTTSMTWLGLGLMGVQFGILARLTWWEYSWDIMEPVTYFVTYGTAMAAYAYFVLTKQEYLLPDVKDRQFLLEFHKRARKVGLDVNEYNRLKDGVAKIEGDLRRLNDPLLRLRPLSEQLREGQGKIPTEEEVSAQKSEGGFKWPTTSKIMSAFGASRSPKER
ncbi:calcium uniporter protein, mitochondrial [Ischnura elegans]|uniref:calcium uniporter protein, mitochondrial n=1 Tax=Ischnura elegans TaxID=197161 RepID=UPI001ED8A356|nr:calcium uniporter protein, mitochondrial [Ischnura elegans]